MTASALSPVNQLVRELLVDTPLARRIGLEPDDLNGAAQQARSDLLAGNAELSLGKFARLVLLDPENTDFHSGLAESALAAGLPDIALQSASVMIAALPERSDGYLMSGRACIMMGETDLALEDLREAEERARATGDSASLAVARRLLAAATR